MTSIGLKSVCCMVSNLCQMPGSRNCFRCMFSPQPAIPSHMSAAHCQCAQHQARSDQVGGSRQVTGRAALAAHPVRPKGVALHSRCHVCMTRCRAARWPPVRCRSRGPAPRARHSPAATRSTFRPSPTPLKRQARPRTRCGPGCMHRQCIPLLSSCPGGCRAQLPARLVELFSNDRKSLRNKAPWHCSGLFVVCCHPCVGITIETLEPSRASILQQAPLGSCLVGHP